MSCVVVSVLDHVSLPPDEIVAGFGVNAAVPNVRAAGTIVTVSAAGVVLGVVGDDVFPPQLVKAIAKSAPIPTRTAIMLPPRVECY